MGDSNRGDREATLFLAGIGIAVVGLVAAIAVAGVGGVRSGMGQRRRHREGPPERGSVPEERHQQTRSAAAR